MEMTSSKYDDAKIGTLFPDELLMEIFSRLPVRSLVRFSCVSQAWHAMLTNDDYCRKKLPTAMSGLFYTPDLENSSEYFSINDQMFSNKKFMLDSMMSFLPSHENFSVHSSCNGLLLCWTWKMADGSESDSRLYVCNPATKRWARIPLPPSDGYYIIMALAFDPCRSPHYRVITISFCDNGDFEYLEIGILSSETGKWVKFDVVCTYHSPERDISVFFNGNIHLLDTRRSTVLGLDLERKACQQLEVPYTSEEMIMEGSLGQFADSLSCTLETCYQIFLWDLINYDKSEWSLKYTIDLQDILEKACINSSPENYWPWECIWIIELHPDLDIIFFRADDKLISYHLGSSNIAEVCTLKAYHPSSLFCTYSPSYYEDYDL